MILSEWLDRANKRFKQLVLLDSADIQWEVGDDGMRATLRNKTKPGSAGTSSNYTGPFTVIRKNDNTVTIKAYDGVTYISRNRIIAGLESAIVAADTDVTITVSGPVYIKVTYSGGIVTTFLNAASLPAQIDGEVYITIADVLYVDGEITKIAQVQRNEIHIAGRIVGS